MLMEKTSKVIVVGDVHLQHTEPKKSQALMFLDWLVSQDFNNEENEVIFLGDLADVNSKPELLGTYVDYFINKFKFKKILIIQGNHDINLMSSILSVFAPIPNVEVITEHTYYKPYNSDLYFVMLPYYNHEGKDIKPMHEVYSNLHLEKDFNREFDYGLGHIEDHTNHFSTKFCDTSKLKVGQWLNGHIHTSNIKEKGNYLGSPILNSSTESGRTPYIAEIDVETKQFELVEVPKFLEYYEVTYPNDLPNITTPLALFLVNDSVDKEETYRFYSEQSKNKGFDFYTRRVLKKRFQADNSELGESEDSLFKTDLEYFEDYCVLYKVENNIADICKEVLRG